MAEHSAADSGRHKPAANSLPPPLHGRGPGGSPPPAAAAGGGGGGGGGGTGGGGGGGGLSGGLSQPAGWQSLLSFTVLFLAWLAGFSSRLFAVIRFESIIHEFDP